MRVKTFPSPQAALAGARAWLMENLLYASCGVLAGGETPLPVYRALARQGVRYPGVLLLSDERWLEPGDPGTNLYRVGQALGPLRERLLPFPLGLSPEQAREWMEERIRPFLPFDFALLGLGEEGHTASLFPVSPALGSSRLVEVVLGPTYPSLRLTLTPKALSGTRRVLFLALGPAKRQAILRVARGEDLPPNRIRAEEKWIFTDQEV